MTIAQYEYIVALANYGSFSAAAEACFVTQPALSMQIQKLENEIGLNLFTRKGNKVSPTATGLKVIEMAREILSKHRQLKMIADKEVNRVEGTFSLGIIPTLSPYLLPLFLPLLSEKYPAMELKIFELTTPQIISKLKTSSLDFALLAGPLNEPLIKEEVLFFEELIVYVSKKSKFFKHKLFEPEYLSEKELLLLNEGHCLRTQVLNLCSIKKENAAFLHQFETGSLETLRNIVDKLGGFTVIPELSIQHLTPMQLRNIRYFRSAHPVRQIVFATPSDFYTMKVHQAIKEVILESVPQKMKKKKGKQLLEL